MAEDGAVVAGGQDADAALAQGADVAAGLGAGAFGDGVKQGLDVVGFHGDLVMLVPEPELLDAVQNGMAAGELGVICFTAYLTIYIIIV